MATIKYPDRRQATKLGILLDSGTVLTGSAARNKLAKREWTETPFADNIPAVEDIPVTPPTQIKVPNGYGGYTLQENPEYPIYQEIVASMKEDYYNALNGEYVGKKIVVMAHNPIDLWFVVPDQEDKFCYDTLMGYVNSTFKWSVQDKYLRLFR